MTTVVAVERSDRVIIGADSQVTAGSQKQTLETGKIVKKGEYTLAVAGRVRLLQALRHADLPAIETWDIDHHISEVFAPRLAEISKKIELDPAESIVLVVVRRRVYVVYGDGTYVRNTNGVYAIGSGATYALGVLSGIDHLPAVTDVERALHVASQNDIGTSGPFTISTVF